MNKYKIYVLFLVILGICSLAFFKAEAIDLPLFGKVIYLDPGHGGLDPGALYKDIEEKDVNLEISKVLMEVLEQRGATVYLTRYDDYDLALPHAVNRKRSDLSRRANLIDNSVCDLYLSIHLNSITSSTWSGAQVFYDDVNPKNKELAQIIQTELKNITHTKRECELTNSMYMYKRIERPGILIEMGFLSNPNDRYLLRQKWYQKRMSEAIIKGILKFFS